MSETEVELVKQKTETDLEKAAKDKYFNAVRGVEKASQRIAASLFIGGVIGIIIMALCVKYFCSQKVLMFAFRSILVPILPWFVICLMTTSALIGLTYKGYYKPEKRSFSQSRKTSA